MRKIITPRGMGKTRELIKMASQTGATIVVSDRKLFFFIEQMASDMELAIEKPISFFDFVHGSSSGHRINKNGYLVDDLDVCINTITPSYKVLAITMSDED